MSLCQVESGIIISSDAHTIKFWNIAKDTFNCEFIIQNSFNDYICKVISIRHNVYASYSENDSNIKIYEVNEPYSNIPLHTLSTENSSITSLIYIKEGNHLVSGCYPNMIRIWSLESFTYIKTIEGIECNLVNFIYQIDNRIMVGGYNQIYIVNLAKGIIESIIKDEHLGKVCSFVKLRDSHTILCGCDKGQMCVYDMNIKVYSIKDTSHNQTINDLAIIDDNTIITCSSDNTIKVWKY